MYISIYSIGLDVSRGGDQLHKGQPGFIAHELFSIYIQLLGVIISMENSEMLITRQFQFSSPNPDRVIAFPNLNLNVTSQVKAMK